MPPTPRCRRRRRPIPRRATWLEKPARAFIRSSPPTRSPRTTSSPSIACSATPRWARTSNPRTRSSRPRPGSPISGGRSATAPGPPSSRRKPPRRRWRRRGLGWKPSLPPTMSRCAASMRSMPSTSRRSASIARRWRSPGCGSQARSPRRSMSRVPKTSSPPPKRSTPKCLRNAPCCSTPSRHSQAATRPRSGWPRIQAGCRTCPGSRPACPPSCFKGVRTSPRPSG